MFFGVFSCLRDATCPVEDGGGHKGGGAPCHCISSDNHIREANGVSHSFVPTGRSRRVNTLILSLGSDS